MAQAQAEAGRKLAEKAQAEADAKRLHANSFLSAVSHDLRQPLATIALRLSSMAPERVSQSDLNSLMDQARAMQIIVDGSLDLSRLESGTFEIDVREVALPHLSPACNFKSFW